MTGQTKLTSLPIWWYSQASLLIKNHQRLMLLTAIDFFSFGILLKTLFRPWKKDVLEAPPGTTITQQLNLWALNMISRLVGFVVRTAAIIFGLVSMIVLALLFILMWIFWFLAPILLIGAIIFGVIEIFKGLNV